MSPTTLCQRHIAQSGRKIGTNFVLFGNDFWRLINKCYEAWDARITEPLQRVIGVARLPGDLPIDDISTFPSWVYLFHQQINDRSSAAKDYASVLDQFASFIYDLPERGCLVFGINEFEHFDDKRRDLSKFWDRWGWQESLDQVIKLQKMDDILKSSAPELKLLTFLEIARARWRPTGSAGKRGLFLLAKRVNHTAYRTV